MAEDDPVTFVGRFDDLRRRRIPRQVCDRGMDAAVLPEIMVAQDEPLPAVQAMEDPANPFRLVAKLEGEIAQMKNQVVGADHGIPVPDQGFVHHGDRRERPGPA